MDCRRPRSPTASSCSSRAASWRPAPTTSCCAPAAPTLSSGASSSSRRRSLVHDVEHDELLGRAFDHRLVGRLAAIARPHHRLIAGAALLFPLVAAFELVQPFLLKVAIDDHILRADWSGLTGVAALFLLALVILAALRAVESYLMSLTGQRVMHDLRAALFRHLLKLDAPFYDRTAVGRLMTRV